MNAENLQLHAGYRADYGSVLHLVVTQMEDHVLVRVFDRTKKTGASRGKVHEDHSSSTSTEAKNYATRWADGYFGSGKREQPKWEWYGDLGLGYGLE